MNFIGEVVEEEELEKTKSPTIINNEDFARNLKSKFLSHSEDACPCKPIPKECKQERFCSILSSKFGIKVGKNESVGIITLKNYELSIGRGEKEMQRSFRLTTDCYLIRSKGLSSNESEIRDNFFSKINEITLKAKTQLLLQENKARLRSNNHQRSIKQPRINYSSELGTPGPRLKLKKNEKKKNVGLNPYDDVEEEESNSCLKSIFHEVRKPKEIKKEVRRWEIIQLNSNKNEKRIEYFLDSLDIDTNIIFSAHGSFQISDVCECHIAFLFNSESQILTSFNEQERGYNMVKRIDFLNHLRNKIPSRHLINYKFDHKLFQRYNDIDQCMIVESVICDALENSVSTILKMFCEHMNYSFDFAKYLDDPIGPLNIQIVSNIDKTICRHYSKTKKKWKCLTRKKIIDSKEFRRNTDFQDLFLKHFEDKSTENDLISIQIFPSLRNTIILKRIENAQIMNHLLFGDHIAEFSRREEVHFKKQYFRIKGNIKKIDQFLAQHITDKITMDYILEMLQKMKPIYTELQSVEEDEKVTKKSNSKSNDEKEKEKRSKKAKKAKKEGRKRTTEDAKDNQSADGKENEEEGEKEDRGYTPSEESEEEDDEEFEEIGTVSEEDDEDFDEEKKIEKKDKMKDEAEDFEEEEVDENADFVLKDEDDDELEEKEEFELEDPLTTSDEDDDVEMEDD